MGRGLAGALAVGVTCTSLCAGDAIDEWAEAIEAMPNGLVDIAALDLPPEFMRHAAGRSIRLAFRQKFRGTVVDPPGLGGLPAGDGAVVEIPDPGWTYVEAVPELRGFRAPIGGVTGPMTPTDEYTPAAEFVARRLARDGLVRTTMRVMHAHDLPWLDGGVLSEETLWRVGLPVDLLRFFRLADRPVAEGLADWHSRAAPEGSIEPTVAAVTFAFEPSRAGFVAVTDDGSWPVGSIRLQLDSAGYTRHRGDGSALDVFELLIGDMTSASFTLAAHHEHARTLAAHLGPIAGDRLTVLAMPMKPSRWAQDNAKVGTARDLREPSSKVIVTLVPRFASRNETSTKFMPGDSLVFRGTEQVFGEIVQSPLAFQGGNVMAVNTSRRADPLLLVGESEVYRNRALGLTEAQVLEMFRVEFGAERVEVVPALSFHLDMDVTVRAGVACVVDQMAGARIVAKAGAEVLAAGGALTVAERKAVESSIERGDWQSFIRTVNGVMADYYDDRGRLRMEFTTMFAADTVNAGGAGALRFLVAMDILVAASTHAGHRSRLTPGFRSYLQTIVERTAAYDAFATRLETLGLRVVRVPALSDAEASLNPINGIQTETAYLVPAWGKPYETLDAAAAQAFHEAFGADVEIVSIRSMGLQTAYGGLHCAVSLYPKLDD